jgi:hypothetical protein
MYEPRWLPDWPDADRTSRMVFIVRGIAPQILLDGFVAGDPMLGDTPMLGNTAREGMA